MILDFLIATVLQLISMLRPLVFLVLAFLALVPPASTQEDPFFVTYTHHMEEPGNLEMETSATSSIPRAGQRFYVAPYVEFEYGVTARWTSEFYLESDSSWGDSTVFTGWRLENRYKPLKREHGINPVLYLEYEDLNEASRIQKEIEGEGPDLTSSHRTLTGERDHELETKLILSSDFHDWNISENLIAAKNFSQSEGVEFGYSFGAYRPLATLASGTSCRFCLENFLVGAEMYGGLGSTLDFTPCGSAHYIAPVVAWAVSDNATLRFSPGFGLTSISSAVLLRFGYTYEIQNFGSRLSKPFRRNR
jgi:hypothetical protein